MALLAIVLWGNVEGKAPRSVVWRKAVALVRPNAAFIDCDRGKSRVPPGLLSA